MNPKKILTKAAFMVLLCFCNMLTAADRADLQRRDSFKKLEDLRAKQKEDAGEDVLYKKRDGGFRPHGLMDDITEPGQSSRIMSAMADEQRVRRHQDAVQNEGRVSLQAFLSMTDEQIQNVREVVIPLNESYFVWIYINDKRRDTLNRQLEKNQNITVVLDCAGAKRIENNCLNSIKEMHKLKIIHAENIRSIGNSFLSECRSLTTLDLSPLSNIIEIGHSFLAECSSLTKLDLTFLSNITTIGHSFLAECRSLTTLDLTPLSNIREIGDHFLSACRGLTTLDLTPLSNVREIGKYFLSGCSGLTTLDLSPLSNIREIRDNFLFRCAGLTTLDLLPLSNIIEIGKYFLCGCSGLTTLDISPLRNVTIIENGFLYGCSELTTLDTSPLRKVTRIGDDFLRDCSRLTTLDISPLRKATRIGGAFLRDCSGLTRERLTLPQNWDFEHRLPENLMQPRVVQQPAPSVAEAEPTQNARPAPVNPQRMIDELRERHIDPKRPGSDYTSMEFGMAGALLQGAEQSQNGYIRRLESVFSTERALMLFQDITTDEDHSSDSDSDHSNR
ncbi:MAG: hypothetical protein NEHIOOID_00500 [Holosporales bacterium]